MSRYLSPEWVQSFNAAIAELDLTDAISAAGVGSLTAQEGTFAVAQVVSGAPDAPAESVGTVGTVRTVLSVDQGRLTLRNDPEGELPVNVTVVLNYDDALAMARGELEPADALAAGRVRVRGELAVLVAGQVVLNAAAELLGPALANLTD